jgi:hypothetical protein
MVGITLQFPIGLYFIRITFCFHCFKTKVPLAFSSTMKGGMGCCAVKCTITVSGRSVQRAVSRGSVSAKRLATCWTTEGSEFESRNGQEYYLLHTSRLALGLEGGSAPPPRCKVTGA